MTRPIVSTVTLNSDDSIAIAFTDHRTLMLAPYARKHGEPRGIKELLLLEGQTVIASFIGYPALSIFGFPGEITSLSSEITQDDLASYWRNARTYLDTILGTLHHQAAPILRYAYKVAFCGHNTYYALHLGTVAVAKAASAP